MPIAPALPLRNVRRHLPREATPNPTPRPEATRPRRPRRVRLPLVAQSAEERERPLRKCIDIAAGKTACSPWLAGLVVSHFLEALTASVARGQAVQIQGFGRFGHYLKVPRKPGQQPYVQPTFDPAIGFNIEVKECCPPREGLLQRRRNYRQNHASFSRPSQAGRSRPWLAMAAARQAWVKEARLNGFDLDQE